MVHFCIIWRSNGQYQRTLHFWYGLCCLAVSCIEWSYANTFIQIDEHYGDAAGAGRHADGSRGGTAHFGRAQGSQRKEREEKDGALFSLPQGALHRSQVRPDLLHLQRRRVVSLKKHVHRGKWHRKQCFTMDKQSFPRKRRTEWNRPWSG